MALDTEISDAELIDRSVRDPELFTAIFDRHSGEILRYVHARLGRDLAEDVTAETFLAAFRARGRFSPVRGQRTVVAARHRDPADRSTAGPRPDAPGCCGPHMPNGRRRTSATGRRNG